MEGERAATTDASEAALAAEELEALLETEDAPAEFVVPEPVVGEGPRPRDRSWVSPGGHGLTCPTRRRCSPTVLP